MKFRWKTWWSISSVMATEVEHNPTWIVMSNATAYVLDERVRGYEKVIHPNDDVNNPKF